MYAFVAATLASAALVSAQTGLTINTPSSVVECQPAALAWTGGTAPYFLSVIPGSQPGAAALETFPDQTGTSFTWSAVDIASGTSITIQLRDSTGTLAYTDAVTIQAGSTTSCVGKGGSSGSSGTAASSAAGSSAPAATVATTGSSAATGAASSAHPTASAAGSASHSSGAPAASGSSASSSGAEKVGAGVFGVAVAALFAAFA